MAPDLNSLPPSRSIPSSPMSQRAMQSVVTAPRRDQTPSPRPSTSSLAATATMNATEASRRSSLGGSPRLGRTTSDRRRSQVTVPLNLTEIGIASPGELSSPNRRGSGGHAFSASSPLGLGGRNTIATGDPHHQRQPSLGDIHNELEQEQEAQVNRMLQLIRAQQHQLDALRLQQSNGQANAESTATGSLAGTAVLDDLTPQSEQSLSFPSIHPAVGQIPRSTGMSSQESPTTSRSPALRPLPSQDMYVSRAEWWPPSPADSARRNSSSRRNSNSISMRDESSYYQAETANLQRENQMLKQRIRELERLLGEQSPDATSTTSGPSSNLATAA